MYIGAPGKNEYQNIHYVLDQLGVSARDNIPTHEHHFHVKLRRPDALVLPKNLVTETEIGNDSMLDLAAIPDFQMLASNELSHANSALVAPAPHWLSSDPEGLKRLLNYIKGLNKDPGQLYQFGDFTYREKGPLGMPSLTLSGPDLEFREGDTGERIENTLNLATTACHMLDFLARKAGAWGPECKVTRLIEQPTKGSLIQSTAPGARAGDYIYNIERLGQDHVRYVIENGMGKKVDVTVNFRNVRFAPEEGSISDSNTINVLSEQLPDYLEHSSSNVENFLEIGAISLAFDNLSGSKVGEILGSNVTLDFTAGGHGWFIDATPGENEEFLPTSNPNVWVARPGSAAEGKMDMLSVLMHEYGHALGLDHSTDANDVMAALLQPGVRKLWSESDLAKLNEVIASNSPEQDPAPVDRNSDGLPVGGQTRSNTQAGRGRLRSGLGIGADDIASDQNSSDAQALRAINAALENGDFQTTQSWDTNGAVSLQNGEAVFTEGDHAMSGLAQAFVMQDGIKRLRFTIKDIDFGDNGAAPSDAFEVALLDAITGLPVAGVTAQTHTDALFNLQANGTLSESSTVTAKGLPGTNGGLLSTNPPKLRISPTNFKNK